MKTLRWFAPLLVTLGIAATWLMSETHAAAPPTHTNVSPPPRAPDLHVSTPVLAASAAPRDPAPAPATDAFTETGVQLKARFAAERVDTAWATTTRQQLDADLGRFATKDAGVRAIECRQSLCRVELAVASRDAGSAYIQTWLRDRKFDGPGYVTPSAEDGTMIMYLGRSGTEL